MRRRLLLLAASAALCLVLGEIAARALLPRPGFVAFPVAETRGVMRADSQRGHAYAPNLSRHVITPDYELDFRTNSLGMRDVEPDSVGAELVRVLAVGDSYPQGLGVQAVAAWPKRLQARLPGVHVFNTGVSGYGLQQIRRTEEVFFPLLAPRAIFAGIYGHGYTRVQHPYVVVGDGAGLVLGSEAGRVDVADDGFLMPAFESGAPRAVSFWIDRHWFLAGHLMHAIFGPRGVGAAPHAPTESPGRTALEHELAPLLDELAALQADAVRQQVPLVALLINPAEPDGGFSTLQRGYNEVIGDFARARGICCVDPLPRLAAEAHGRTLRLGSDPHWSPLAHDLAAGLVVETLQRSLAAPSAELLPCQAAARAVAGDAGSARLPAGTPPSDRRLPE